jgi:hypothetical protein
MHQQAVQPVSDDLFFLAALGVRTVAIAEGTNNLATGDVGVPIDPLVQAEANAVDVEPVASYYPGAGQYWLAFRPLAIGAALLAGEFLLTSTIYPIEFIDGYNATGLAVKGRVVNQIIDGYGSAATPISGTLREVLKSTEYETEGYEAEATPVSGNIRVAIKSFVYEPEGYETDVTPVGGTLRVAVVSHEYETEGYEATATPLGGTLT